MDNTNKISLFRADWEEDCYAGIENIIDCCGFAKEPHGDIVISKFDFSSYHIDNNALSTDEITSIT